MQPTPYQPRHGGILAAYVAPFRRNRKELLRRRCVLQLRCHSPLTIVAFVITAVMFIAAVFAPWVAPYDTYDLGSLSLIDAYKPPAWSPGGDPNYLLGHGRPGSRCAFRDDLRAALSRCSSAFSGVILAALLGTVMGLLSGYFGGWIDAVIMRIADVQLTFPAILIALMIDGVASTMDEFPGPGRFQDLRPSSWAIAGIPLWG